MKTITDLCEILQSHAQWLNGSEGAKANLIGVDLSGANLIGVDLSEANLIGANLSEANLGLTDLSKADLSGANLSGANLSEANLRWADFSAANLSGADLNKSDLDKADLSGANLSEADLSGANLSRANLSGANLNEANLEKIKEDFIFEIKKVSTEIPALRQALIEGRIDGTSYTGDCACLAGTVSKGLGISYLDLPARGFVVDSQSLRERWFLQIRPGHTPETSQACAITVAWIDALSR